MPFRELIEDVSRTGDDLRDLVINNMRYLQILCTGHPSFFLRQLVQPLQPIFDLSPSDQLLCVLF